LRGPTSKERKGEKAKKEKNKGKLGEKQEWRRKKEESKTPMIY